MLTNVLARVGKIGILCMVVLSMFLFPARGHALITINQAEGSDFATHVLGDPWDMSEYSDISQYINQSGQSINLGNISVANGVFSARTLTGDAWFFPLWTGYNTAMLLGKVGANYPINSAQYQCLYVAAKVNATDVMRVFWFADERLNVPGDNSTFGQARINLNASSQWQLYKVNFVANHEAYATWTSRSQWKGFRINPTIGTNKDFSVDWVRLTSCDASGAVDLNLGGLTNNKTYGFYLLTSDSREIFIDSFVAANNRVTVDLRGVAAGSYTYRLKDGATVVNTGTLNINQSPIVKFTSPSPTSGQDYATSAGNAWDFSDSDDVTSYQDLDNVSFANGLFNFTSPTSKFGVRYDSIIHLNSPVAIPSASQYRYVTIRMRTDGPWQNVPNGMMGRFIWHIPVQNNTNSCWLVSQDIPYDIGWQTITIDLTDPFNGAAEETGGACAGVPTTWSSSSNVTILRFDPSENETDAGFVQALDWIKLTAEDKVTKGELFPIAFDLNKSKSGVTMTYYYTTTRSNPTQNKATVRPIGGPVVPVGNNKVYIPAIYSKSTGAPGAADGMWVTDNVAPGKYYICAEANDGLNSSIFCSESPVNVVQ